MTDREWLTSDSTVALLRSLEGKASDRRLRLFGCACARLVWHLLSGDSFRRTVELAEQLADERVPPSVLGKMTNEVTQAGRGGSNAEKSLTAPLRELLTSRLSVSSVVTLQQKVWLTSELQGEEANSRLVELLRDIYGNPFRPAALDPAWLTPTVVQLAEANYDERLLPSGHLDPARLAVLSDALEEAGCSDAAILDHLRHPGPHVRGCWVIDGLTGRS